MKTVAKRSKYWTKERIRSGLQRFFDDFGQCPLASGLYNNLAANRGLVVNGRASNLGWHHPYPSVNTVLRNYPTFRDAWRDAGFEVDRGTPPWTPDEDWFVLESVGLLPRTEVAELLHRTAAAIKRRLYDLTGGRIHASNRWGLTATAAAHLLHISEQVIIRYIRHGIIPHFRGFKCIYINPADLPLITEVDWSSVSAEAEALIRRSLVHRAVRIITLGPEFRSCELYKHTKPDIRPRRYHTDPSEPPEKPNEIGVGDWVRTEARLSNFAAEGRIGIVKAVHFSPQNWKRLDGTRRKCWVARVEFPRLRWSKVHHNETRIRYSLPLDCLSATDEPVRTAKKNEKKNPQPT